MPVVCAEFARTKFLRRGNSTNSLRQSWRNKMSKPPSTYLGSTPSLLFLVCQFYWERRQHTTASEWQETFFNVECIGSSWSKLFSATKGVDLTGALAFDYNAAFFACHCLAEGIQTIVVACTMGFFASRRTDGIIVRLRPCWFNSGVQVFLSGPYLFS